MENQWLEPPYSCVSGFFQYVISLEDRFFGKRHVMLHALRHVKIAASLHGLSLIWFELVAHADDERAGNHRYIFVGGMRVGRYRVSGRNLDPIAIGSLF